jgi:hypothetical protein
MSVFRTQAIARNGSSASSGGERNGKKEWHLHLKKIRLLPALT